MGQEVGLEVSINAQGLSSAQYSSLASCSCKACNKHAVQMENITLRKCMAEHIPPYMT